MQTFKAVGYGLLMFLACLGIVALFAGPPYLFLCYMGWPMYMLEYVGALWSFILLSVFLGFLYGKGII